MTLGELQQNIKDIHPGGRAVSTSQQMQIHQKRAFSKLFQWCTPLNLLVAYNDRDIEKIVDDVWRLKSPRIAKNTIEYIDIDKRLELAFTYALISLTITGNGKESKIDKAEYEDMAYREALEYAVKVEDVGYDTAKLVYEMESFVTGVEFDCLGRVYHVSSAFVDMVIDCILCGRQCMNSAEYSQLELYKSYIDGDVKAVDYEKLLAVDKAVFYRLMNDVEKLTKYSSEDLARASTLFCEFSKIDQGVDASGFAVVEDKRMGFMECDKPVCESNNRCEGL
jgi:hypothetical protein